MKNSKKSSLASTNQGTTSAQHLYQIGCCQVTYFKVIQPTQKQTVGSGSGRVGCRSGVNGPWLFLIFKQKNTKKDNKKEEIHNLSGAFCFILFYFNNNLVHNKFKI